MLRIRAAAINVGDRLGVKSDLGKGAQVGARFVALFLRDNQPHLAIGGEAKCVLAVTCPQRSRNARLVLVRVVDRGELTGRVPLALRHEALCAMRLDEGCVVVGAGLHVDGHGRLAD